MPAGAVPSRMPTPEAVLVSVGNTRTRVAAVVGGRLQPSQVALNGDPSALAALVREHVPNGPGESGSCVVAVASVNHGVRDALLATLAESGWGRGTHAARVVLLRAPGSAGAAAAASGGAPIGTHLDVPMRHALESPVTVGVDRLLAALGAHARSGEACVVIDAGTAVTVDFVDAWGVFQGGCIAPGLAMSLRALHEHTAALPLVDVSTLGGPSGLARSESPLGRSTADAIALGCMTAIRGLVHRLIDQYAAMNNAYPRIIATGGDAPLLFEHDELVEHIVPDLILVGMHAALEAGAERAG